MRIFRKLKRSEKGQGIVEFALILPILLFLIMGIIQFGLIFLGHISVSNAAREGARVGIIQSTYTEARSKAIEKVNDTFEVTPALSKTGDALVVSTFNPGAQFSVTVNGEVDIIVPLFDFLFPTGKYPVSGVSIMRVEGYNAD